MPRAAKLPAQKIRRLLNGRSLERSSRPEAYAARWMLALASAALLGAPAAPLAARAPLAPVQEANFTLDGKISDLAPGKLTISTEENIIFHVRYTDQTRITRADGSPGSPKDFRIGVRVHVAGDLTESGEIDAAAIQLQAPSGSKPPHGPKQSVRGSRSQFAPSGNSFPLP